MQVHVLSARTFNGLKIRVVCHNSQSYICDLINCCLICIKYVVKILHENGFVNCKDVKRNIEICCFDLDVFGDDCVESRTMDQLFTCGTVTCVWS